MKKLVIIFAVCLSIGIENSYAQSAKDNKPAKTGVAATRSGPTKGRILNDEEIKKVKNLILRGYTCYVQDLYRHYELIGDSEKCSE